jgi:DNA-binding NarL/FixJ family response regulator
MKKSRVAIIEDDLENRKYIKKMINNTQKFVVDFEVSSYEELIEIERTNDYNPDILLLDMSLSTKKDGMDVLLYYEQRKKRTKPKIVIVSCDFNNYMLNATEAKGANGYIVKSFLFRSDSAFLEAVLTTIQHSNQFIKILSSDSLNKNIKISDEHKKMVRLLKEGKKVGEIAEILNKNPSTTTNTFLQIRNKLGVSTNEQLVIKASELGLV